MNKTNAETKTQQKPTQGGRVSEAKGYLLVSSLGYWQTAGSPPFGLRTTLGAMGTLESLP